MDLFDKSGKYTPEAAELGRIIEKALGPIFKRWREAGYSFRDISHIASLATTSLESELVITEAARNRRRIKEG